MTRLLRLPARLLSMSISNRFILAIMIAAIGSAAYASGSLMMMGIGPGLNGSSGSSGGGCVHNLKFNVACNSQYINTIIN